MVSDSFLLIPVFSNEHPQKHFAVIPETKNAVRPASFMTSIA